jgi:aspartokinase-like uncharacterized kinase
MSLDAVIKVGGSLSCGKGLPDLCGEIGRLGTLHPLLVVPGGGGFADQVREVYRRYSLNETTAHRMALLAMDQCGYVLNQLIPGSYLATDLPSVCSAAESGRVAILLPSAPVLQEDPLPHSWEVTSDSIAAWVAYRVRCRRLVLLKDVDGLFAPSNTAGSPAKLITNLNVDQLAAHAGGVDDYLSRFLNSACLETWVINGLRPERLVELLDTGHTTGTHIFK